MTGEEWVAALVLTVLLLGLAAAFLDTRRGPSSDVTLTHTPDRDGVERWKATTGVGTATLSRVFVDGQGERFLVETRFRGQPPREFYTPPSLASATLALLHAAEDARRG